MPDFSPSFLEPVELAGLLFEFLLEPMPMNEPNLFFDFFGDEFGRFDDDGFAGGGGGGSLVTEVMMVRNSLEFLPLRWFWVEF